jgi:hypothetical protein
MVPEFYSLWHLPLGRKSVLLVLSTLTEKKKKEKETVVVVCSSAVTHVELFQVATGKHGSIFPDDSIFIWYFVQTKAPFRNRSLD